MAILHYTIGLPPTRNGGSVHYAYGLIVEQSRTEDVLVVTPGDTLFRHGKAKIKTTGKRGNVRIFHLTNPLTPTLIYGASDPVSQHRNIDVDYDNIRNFIVSNGITVMHLHTLMGLHSKIVRFINDMGVKIVYTTHDFHGICLHYDLLDRSGELCGEADSYRCTVCNLHQPSDIFLRMANSSLYQKLKQLGVIKMLSKPKVKSELSVSQDGLLTEIIDETVQEYEGLIDYYRDYFRLIDKFHFNSSQTERVFKHFLPFAKGKVIPVTTQGIRDKRKRLKVSKEITFGFVGSLNEYKGFPTLKKVLMELRDEGYSGFRLKAYPGDRVGVDPDCDAISYEPPYSHSEISDVMYGIDCMIIPSKWYETFSLVALEALAHGRPVIVSDRVGAQDIVRKFSPEMIFDSPEALKERLRNILDNPHMLLRYSERICSGEWEYSLERHAEEVLDFYKK